VPPSTASTADEAITFATLGLRRWSKAMIATAFIPFGVEELRDAAVAVAARTHADCALHHHEGRRGSTLLPGLAAKVIDKTCASRRNGWHSGASTSPSASGARRG
jgi:hypothetical protein